MTLDGRHEFLAWDDHVAVKLDRDVTISMYSNSLENLIKSDQHSASEIERKDSTNIIFTH